jgi:tetratricopeptide (TPR) repeat protein
MFGDALQITLPHSHIDVFAAHLFWQDMDPRDKRPAMFPDIAVEPRFSDYLKGTDPALTLALTAPAPETIEDALTAALPRGADAILARYNKFTADPTHKFVNNPEARVNTLGYTLMRAKRLPDAITIFDVNVRANPNSFNAWDSLGEAYLATGKTEQGLTAYKKSLELNPNNNNAKRIIEQAANQH